MDEQGEPAMNKRWELKVVYVPLTQDIQRSQKKGLLAIGEDYWIIPTRSEETEKSWAMAEQMAREGWELVGIAPCIAGHEVYHAEGGCGCSVTIGYNLFFKRSID